MKTKFMYAAVICGFTLSSYGWAADNFEVVTEKSKVEFLAVGKPGFLKIRGEGGTVSGTGVVDAGKFSGTFTAQLAGIKTGIDLRDEHMHTKYLETQKFATATLALQDVKFANGTTGACTFDGQLTVKGVSKAVRGECDIQGVGSDVLTVKASTEINIEDFPIGVPSHLGIKVADKVTISTDFQAKKL